MRLTFVVLVLATASIALGQKPSAAGHRRGSTEQDIKQLDHKRIQAQINADGSQQLHYDLGALSNGSYTVTVAAVNGFAQESPFTPPFTFTVGAPATPTGLRLSPT